jgi:hypothetical protein
VSASVPRKPMEVRPPPPPKDPEAWVTSKPDSQGAETPATEPPETPAVQPASVPRPRRAKKGRRARVVRADGRELVRLLVYLPPDLAKALDLHSAEHEVDKSEVVTTLLARLLRKPG